MANVIASRHINAFGKTFKAFRDGNSLRTTIVKTAEEKLFSAGWDLKTVASGDAVDGDYGVDGFGRL